MGGKPIKDLIKEFTYKFPEEMEEARWWVKYYINAKTNKDNNMQDMKGHDNTVCYYYKDPETGLEMNFTKSTFGWAVSFPDATIEQLRVGMKLAQKHFPKLSEQEQAIVDENYKKLHKLCPKIEEGV